MTTKARLAYGMVRKTYGIVPSTATFYKTEFLRALNSGYRATFAWVAAQEQILPRSGYAGLSLFLQQYYVDVAQTGFILSGTDSILDKLAEVVTKVSGSSAGTPEQLKSEIKRSIHSEMSKVIEKLGLEESIKSETLSAAGFFQVWSLTQLYFVDLSKSGMGVKSALSTNAQSMFASAVFESVLGPPHLALHTLVSL